MTDLNYTYSDKSITVTIGFKPVQILASDPLFETVKNLIASGADEEAIKTEIDRAAQFIAKSGGVFTVKDGVAYVGDNRVNDFLTKQFFSIKDAGMDTLPWEKFVANVYDNPSETAREELFQFLEKSNLPITPDGCFLAYKKVKADYTDCYTGKIDNSIGAEIPRMDRDKCDPDRNNTCSTGYHFCSYTYLQHFWGAHIMVVKVNPRDVTAIPIDYNRAKGRCCYYEIVAELDVDPTDKTFTKPIEPTPKPEPDYTGWVRSKAQPEYFRYLDETGGVSFLHAREIAALNEEEKGHYGLAKECNTTPQKLEGMRLKFLEDRGKYLTELAQMDQELERLQAAEADGSDDDAGRDDDYGSSEYFGGRDGFDEDDHCDLCGDPNCEEEECENYDDD